jgi:hypothetical protein
MMVLSNASELVLKFHDFILRFFKWVVKEGVGLPGLGEVDLFDRLRKVKRLRNRLCFDRISREHFHLGQEHVFILS